jgi:hypothetical protein
MPDVIPNLWPKEFKVDVQTPYAILRVQAELLSKVTRGILYGEVETEAAKHQVQHRLVVVAPAYNSYRHTLIVVLHNPHLPYPAEVRAESLEMPDKRGEPYGPVYPSANSDTELQQLVERALHSGPTRAAILSLIAKSNEAAGTVPVPVQLGTNEGPTTTGAPDAGSS